MPNLRGLGGSMSSFGGMRDGLMGSAMYDPMSSPQGTVMSGGGMDVAATQRKFSNFGGGFNMSNMSGGGMY
jgi:hypothetical protein